ATAQSVREAISQAVGDPLNFDELANYATDAMVGAGETHPNKITDTWCGDLDFKAAALHYVKTIYLVLPWGAVQIFAPHRGNAPHRGDPQTLLLSPNLQIPVDALVCVLMSSRDHYEPLVKRP
ncbi:hypothetical protein M885DRAFT_580086, partial [Pelagophyceae sp. CCMP2097]